MLTATGFTGPLTGNVTGNITGTAPAGTLTGNTLASGVTASSLTSLGTQAANLNMGSNTVYGVTQLSGSHADGPRIAGDEASSATNPTFIVDRQDMTTGIGGTSAYVSSIVAGTERIRATTSGATVTGTVDTTGQITATVAGHPFMGKTSTRWGGINLQDTSSNNLFQVYPDDVDLGGTIMVLSDAGTAKIALDTDGNSYLNGGNVGIGVTDPDHLLEINNADGASMLKLERTGGNAGTASFNIGGADPGFNLVVAGTSGDFTVNTGSARRLRVASNGTVAVGDFENNVGAITGQLAIGAQGGSGKYFRFMDTAGTPTKYNFQMGVQEVDNAMTLSHSTAVGGTTFSPALAVTHEGDVRLYGDSTNVTWDASDNSLEFVDSSSASFGTGGDMKIWHNSNVNRIDLTSSLGISGGNVGIGTDAPHADSLVDIRNGTTYISGDDGSTAGTHSNDWLVRIQQNTNSARKHGLSVMNAWANTDSVIFEAAMGWNGAATGYYPVFTIDGLGNFLFKNKDSGANTITEKMRLTTGGNLGIGVPDPDAKLEVAGQVKITGGSPGADKVLTSDADGLATWEEASGGGGGTMQLTVASGQTITPGMAVGVNSSGQAVEYTTTGADYIPPIMYSYPETQSTYTIRSPEIAYDTETNIHVMIFNKYTASNGEDVRDGGVNQGIFAVPFEIDANDNITFGTEMRITSDRAQYGNHIHLQYLETRQQMVATITVSTSETVVFLLKPKATNPTTVVASSELSISTGSVNYYKTMFADASSGSDHRGIISYTGGSYYTKVRVLDFGTAWNETQGAAHGITAGSETNLYNQASYNEKPGVWMRSTHSGGGKQMCVFGYYAFKYGFDIGTSGTTISNITIGHWGASQPKPSVAVYTGTPGWAFVYASYSSYASYLIPVAISSDNSTSEGAIANSVAGGGTGDSGMQGLVYTGTTNTMMVINGRNSGAPSGGVLPGNGAWSNQRGKYTKRMTYNSGWVVASPNTSVDTADLFLNPYAQGEHEGLGSIGHDFDPDRSRVVIASTTTAGNPSRGDLSEARFGTYAGRTTGIWMMKISGTTAPLDNYGTLAGMFVGFGADASNVTAGNTVTVTIKGGVNEHQSGLAVGQHYFMNEFGTLYANGLPDMHQASLYVGRAVAATKLIVDGSKGWSFR